MEAAKVDATKTHSVEDQVQSVLQPVMVMELAKFAATKTRNVED